MKVLSVNVGRPRDIAWREKTITTGIYKVPVSRRIMLRTLGLDGDGQADPTVHGGKWQAAYVYPSEHTAFWAAELPGMDLPPGVFGENLTSAGLLETSVHIGDTLRIGAALVRVTAPRLPCYKLGIRFGRSDMIQRFLHSGRTGFYLMVESAGEVGAGDRIEILETDPRRITVADFVRLHRHGADDPGAVHRLLEIDSLPDGWRNHFEKMLAAS